MTSSANCPPSVSYDDWLIEQLKGADHAAAYLEAVTDDGYGGQRSASTSKANAGEDPRLA